MNNGQASFWSTFRRSPLMTALFTAIFLYGIAVAVNRTGWFAPGPPLDSLELEARVVEYQRVRFQITGRQTTDRALLSFTASWTFSDGTALPAAIYGENGRVSTIPHPPNVEPGQFFRTETLRVIVPPAVHNDAMTQLRLCWSYYELPTLCIATLFTSIPLLITERSEGYLPEISLSVEEEP